MFQKVMMTQVKQFNCDNNLGRPSLDDRGGVEFCEAGEGRRAAAEPAQRATSELSKT